MSIRISPGQEGEVSTELALPVLTSQHPSSKCQKGCQKMWKRNTALLQRALPERWTRRCPSRDTAWLLSIGSAGLSPSRLQATLWVFNCINWSYLPDIQLHCCQQQLFPLTQPHQETTKAKTKPSFLRSWPVPILNAPKAKHFPGPRGGYCRTALPAPRVPGSTASSSQYPGWKNNPR